MTTPDESEHGDGRTGGSELTGAGIRHGNERRRADDSPATYRISESDSATESVLHAVSIETGTDPMELPPLYSAVDPDALNALFATGETGSDPANGRIVFRYYGHSVRIESGGTLRVSEADDETTGRIDP